MKKYSPYWRMTVFAAIAFHFLMALGFSYVLPHLMPEPTIEDVAEFEWVDVDLLPPDVVIIEAEAIPSETPQETLPLFNAQDLFIPELTIPELKIEPTPVPEPKTIEPPKPQPPPQVVRNEQEAKQQVETEPEKEVVVVQGKQQLEHPPVTITEFYPEKGSGLGYKGYVSIAATIGKDGKVKATKVMRTSGRYFVDEIARKAAMQWTFKPALDKDGKPMECDKIITFDFKNFSDA